MVTHLDQHVQRVEAVDLVAQGDEAVELRLDALEDLVHHQAHQVLPGEEGGGNIVGMFSVVIQYIFLYILHYI